MEYSQSALSEILYSWPGKATPTRHSRVPTGKIKYKNLLLVRYPGCLRWVTVRNIANPAYIVYNFTFESPLKYRRQPWDNFNNH